MTQGNGGYESISAWYRLWALLRLRCVRCCRGKIFRGLFTMNDPCPVCGMLFQCEPGYFLGAMYVSYGIASALLCGGYFLLVELLPDWNPYLLVGLLVLFYLPLVPFVFQYSRAIWIYFDRWGRPSDVLAGSYERARIKELSGQEAKESPATGPADRE